MAMTKYPRRYMEDCIEAWQGRPPNGSMIVAFVKDVVALWRLFSAIKKFKRQQGIPSDVVQLPREWEDIMKYGRML